MKSMHEQYLCGPYQGYCGRADYDADSDLFHGEVVGTRDVITFQGRTLQELREAFRGSVDDYLAFCAASNDPPEKAFSGKFMARLAPDLHRKLSALAELSGKSLNQFISDSLENAANALPAMNAPIPTKAKKSKRAAGRKSGKTGARKKSSKQTA